MPDKLISDKSGVGSFTKILRESSYHQLLDELVVDAYELATKARKRKLDPKDYVEIHRAENVALRTQALVGPRKIASRIQYLELKKGLSKEEVALKVAEEIVTGKFGTQTEQKLCEQALRTALSILTEGITAAPLEGISTVKIKQNNDGTRFLSVYYAGPIRSAGGTAQGLSVVIAISIANIMNLANYDATEQEAKRMVEEVRLYDSLVHLQLFTTSQEIEHAWQNLPIMIQGTPTGQEEVSGYRDIKTMETNKVRGGACLVLNDGIVGRASKLLKRVKKLKLDGYSWLQEIADKKFRQSSEGIASNLDENNTSEGYIVKPDPSFLSDIVTGRPILAGATKEGGFRLRYGHARNTGLSAYGVNPGFFGIIDDYLVTGTHIRLERPGKGSILCPVDTINPPIVLLDNGDLIEIESYSQGKRLANKIKKILFLGDILVGYGEFIQNNYSLVPSGYVEEWWAQEVLRTDYRSSLPKETAGEFFHKVLQIPPDEDLAIEIARNTKVPLHPKYTPAWKYLTGKEVITLRNQLKTSKEGEVNKKNKHILEKALIFHKFDTSKNQVRIKYFKSLKAQLAPNKEYDDRLNLSLNGLKLVQMLATINIMDVMGTPVGARMGRPEKAAPRKFSPMRHSLFPIGKLNPAKNNLLKAEQLDTANVKIGTRLCDGCNKESLYVYCITCKIKTNLVGKCRKFGCNSIMEEGPCDKCGSEINYGKSKDISFKNLLEKARERIGEIPLKTKLIREIKNKYFIPELLEKGVLRAKYNLSVFRDGTIRYDITDAPLTHFKPVEIGTPIEKIRKLGYKTDIYGNALTSNCQTLSLFAQDIILNENAKTHLINISKFIDELLTRVYNLDTYYNIEQLSDLVGKLVIGIAPHTSAGVIGRIIGFNTAFVCWAHPFWHAAKRRNCIVGDEDTIIIDKNGKIKILKLNAVENLDLTKYRILSFNKNWEIEPRKIKEIVKIPAPRTLLKLKTSLGREITVTPDHKMIKVKNKMNQTIIPAEELKLGDHLCILANLNVKVKTMEINLFEYYYKGEKDTKIVQQTITKRLLVNEIQPKNVPASGSVKKSALAVRTLGKYEKEACIKNVKRANFESFFIVDKHYVPTKIKLTKDLGTLIGIYLKFGDFSINDMGKTVIYQITWTVPTIEFIQNIERICNLIFGTNPLYKNENGKFQSLLIGRVYYDFFIKIFQLGNKKEKSVSNLILNGPDKFRKAIILSCLCPESSNQNQFAFSSRNKTLVNQLGLLALSIGWFPEYNQESKKKNTKPILRYKLSVNPTDLGIKNKNMKTSFQKDTITKIEVLNQHSEKFVYDFILEDEKNFICGFGWFGTYDCDGDEDGIILLLDGLLNFSKEYLPNIRGSQMDTPLVLVTNINPAEVDDEAFNIDAVNNYPLHFYQKTLHGASQNDFLDKITRIESFLNTKMQFGHIPFTHETTNIAKGGKISKYKQLPTMKEKLNNQLLLAKLIHAVDDQFVASQVLKKHFIKDLMGNLRRFTSQTFYCPVCSKKFRRIPLNGKCTNSRCRDNSKLRLTVFPASISKYLELSEKLIREFNLDVYYKDRLDKIRMGIEGLFPKDEREQLDLATFLG